MAVENSKAYRDKKGEPREMENRREVEKEVKYVGILGEKRASLGSIVNLAPFFAEVSFFHRQDGEISNPSSKKI